MVMFGMVKTGSNSFAISSGVLLENRYLLMLPRLLNALASLTLYFSCVFAYVRARECERHRAPGARKCCGPRFHYPEPADHIDNSGGRRADNDGCSRGPWGGGSGMSEVQVASLYTPEHLCTGTRPSGLTITIRTSHYKQKFHEDDHCNGSGYLFKRLFGVVSTEDAEQPMGFRVITVISALLLVCHPRFRP